MSSLSISKKAVELIVSRRTSEQSYNDLIQRGESPINDILTFGWVITPIMRNVTAGHVVFWRHNGNVTVTDIAGKLLGVEVGRGMVATEEALEIWVATQEKLVSR